MPQPSAQPPITHLLYLHGFRSSPDSFKAVMVRDWLAAHAPTIHIQTPSLPSSPLESLLLVQELTAAWPRQTMAVMGSSLGGFYARHLARHWGCQGVSLNPAVHPARDLVGYVGVHPVWQRPDETMEFKSEYLAQFEAWSNLPSAAQRPPMFAVIAKGDELLDWREMTAAHQGDDMLLLEGSDHGLSDFAAHLPHAMRYLGLAPAQV